jgi:Cft2 family RNA processing exonuclease
MAQYMDTVEISIKKQIQNELIRSRNSMIKDFRREIFEKITHAFRSQGVYVVFPIYNLEFFMNISGQIQQLICTYSNLIVSSPKWLKIV